MLPHFESHARFHAAQLPNGMAAVRGVPTKVCISCMYAFDGLHLYEDTIRAFLIGRYLDDGLDSIPDQRGVGVVLNSCFIHVDGDDRGMERETLRE